MPHVIEILATEHGWDKARKKSEMENAKAFLETFKSLLKMLNLMTENTAPVSQYFPSSRHNEKYFYPRIKDSLYRAVPKATMFQYVHIIN